LSELKEAADELEKSQREVETRKAALEDRRAKMARKPKPELEEQVRGAEMLLKEAYDRHENIVRRLAESEVSAMWAKNL
jgi:hypothetical protein